VRKLLYAISHTTTYDYVGEVSLSHHLLRLTPRSDGRQLRLAHELTLSPQPRVVQSYTDYFGNLTHLFDLHTPHQQLVIKSETQVALGLPYCPEPLETLPWEIARARCHDDRSTATLEALEFTYDSPLVSASASIRDYAETSFAPTRPLLDAVLDLTGRIHEDFAFQVGATTVTTPLSAVFANRRGVCQDFAHLQLACLHALGLPARYVSGYLETDPPPGKPKLRGADASHAWVSFFCPGIGWLDVDPTNNCMASLRHIAIGWGRDYSDVAPVRGVLVGGESQTVQVGVDVNALGPSNGDLSDLFGLGREQRGGF
jgi:transglutaminase-like putative cysteine protease